MIPEMPFSTVGSRRNVAFAEPDEGVWGLATWDFTAAHAECRAAKCIPVAFDEEIARRKISSIASPEEKAKSLESAETEMLVTFLSTETLTLTGSEAAAVWAAACAGACCCCAGACWANAEPAANMEANNVKNLRDFIVELSF